MMSTFVVPTDKRVPNFSGPEKAFLVNLIAKKFAGVLEDKKTNRTSINDKNQAWKKIEAEFNASAPVLCFRNADSLKRLYENKIKKLRRKLAKEKEEAKKTGGGLPEMINSDLDEVDKILMTILNEVSLVGDNSEFDDDYDALPPQAPPNSNLRNCSGNYDFEFMPTSPGRYEFEFTQNMLSNLDDGMEETENSNAKKKFKTATNINNKCLDEGAKTVQAGKTRQSENQQAKPGCSKWPVTSPPTPKFDSSRRRPMITTRALTSSDVAEKYNLLLDKRLVLVKSQISDLERSVEFKKHQEELQLEALKLEIQYKKTLVKKQLNSDWNV